MRVQSIELMDAKELPIIPTSVASNRSLTRREIFQRFLGALGAALAGAQVAGAHPIHKHLSHPESLLHATSKVADEWSPEFLDPHQNETLRALAERILPGSGEARVNRVIDLLLTVETAGNRQKFVAAVAAIDGQSQKRFGRPAKALDPAQQDDLLNLCSTAKSGNEGEDGDSFTSAKANEKAPIRDAVTLRDHFETLKGWVVGVYYSSEPGMRELGWTDDFYFDALPECSHPDGHR